jgi:type III secretion protein U
MPNQDTEERTLPPSAKKLRDLRRKGQVARSRDMVAGVAMAGSLGFVMLAGMTIVTTATAMIDTAGDVAAGDFDRGLDRLLPVIRHAATGVVLPLLILVPTLAVVSAIVVLGGVPFSTDPISPKLEKISPIEGFKRIFKMHALIELIKSLVKTTVIAAAFVAVLAGGLKALVLAPAAGLDAEIALLRALAMPLFGTAAMLFLVAGAADAGLQQWLFRREQKMSLTEMKRERKDMDGDPHVKRERKRIMREALRLAGGLGMRRATIVIHDGGGMTVGLRYKINEMPAPVVVCRGRDARARAMLSEADAMRVAVAEDAELVRHLFRLPLGHGIPERLFRPMALALRNAGSV